MRNNIRLFVTLVPFILITALIVPSTFGECTPDVSGKWVLKIVGKVACCEDSSDNGQAKFEESIEVTQDGNNISASWVDDDKDRNQHTITGIINANSVYFKEETYESDQQECGSVTYYVGILKGKQIEGYATGGEYGCDTCKYYGKIKIKIIK